MEDHEILVSLTFRLGIHGLASFLLSLPSILDLRPHMINHRKLVDDTVRTVREGAKVTEPAFARAPRSYW